MRFDLDFCLSHPLRLPREAAGFLTAADRHYIFTAARLIAFELGLRFFADWLTGDHYFKTADAEHNLRRAVVQFRLTAVEIERAGRRHSQSAGGAVMSTYELAPFARGASAPLRLEAILRREGEKILLCYLLRGALGAVAVPDGRTSRNGGTSRWRRTCFELFIGPAAGPVYHELNLSPAGHWNVYAFDDYRAGMRPEPAVGSLAFTVAREEKSLAVVLELELAPFYPPGTALRAGLAAVLVDRAGKLTYWALAHPEDRPDFHRRENFIVAI